jgi:type IV secretion system protein TrbL
MDKTTGSNGSQDCFSCSTIRLYLDKSEDFTDRLADALQVPMLTLFASLVGVWVIIIGIRFLINPGSAKNAVADNVLNLLIASILLGGHANGLISQAYTAALATMSGAATIAFEVGGVPAISGYSGLEGLIATLEQAIYKVLQVCAAIAKEGGMTDLGPIVYSILLAIPYIGMLALYIGQVIMALFRIIAITAMSPILALFFGFSWGRQMTASGVKFFISSGLILFGCTLAMGFALAGVDSLNMDNAEDASAAWTSLNNGELVVVLIMGITGIVLMLEATSIANAIVGGFLSNNGASSIAGGMSGAAQAAGNAAGTAGKNFIGNAVDAFQGGMESRQQRAASIEQKRAELIEKMSNANQ